MHLKGCDANHTIDAMQCPRDHTDLDYRHQENALGYVCETCQGIYLPTKSVKWFDNTYQTNVLESLFLKQQIAKPSILCPNCNCFMPTVDFGDAEIDICRHCKSIWFDQYEVTETLKQMRTAYSHKDSLAVLLLEILAGLTGISA